MQLHELTKPSSRRSARRIGRGSTRGKTSGKGHKGQKSRAGHRIRPAERDIIKRIPKLRGHGINRSKTVNSGKVRPEVVNLTVLEKTFTASDEVSPKSLAQKGIVSRSSGRLPQVKILGTGTLTKKLSVSGCTLSATAQRAIEAAGEALLLLLRSAPAEKEAQRARVHVCSLLYTTDDVDKSRTAVYHRGHAIK